MNELSTALLEDLDGLKNGDLRRPERWTFRHTNKFKLLPLGLAQTMSAYNVIGSCYKVSVPHELYNEICHVYENKVWTLNYGYEICRSRKMMYLLSSKEELTNLIDDVERWKDNGCDTYACFPDTDNESCLVCEDLIKASVKHYQHIREIRDGKRR